MTYSPFRHIGSIFWKHRPIHYTFFLTKRCNAKCPFCFYLSGKDAPADITEELSLDEIQKVSSSMGDLLWLAFSGGEIFLRDDLVEITKIFYKANRPAIILLPTNGLMPAVIRERVGMILESCPESTIVVKLSVEGPESINDSIRGKGSFEKTMETYSMLGELLDEYPNFELGINTVFCSGNQDSMDELIELVNGLEKIKTHTVSLIRGNVADEGLKDVDMEKYYETVDRMAVNLRENTSSVYRFRGATLKAAQDILQRRLIYETYTRNRRMVPCHAGRLNLVVSETGDVYPCELLEKKIGNIRESGYDIKKLLGSGQALEIIRSIRKDGCFCTHECYFMTNILFSPSAYPELLKEYLRM
jgi:radical SAM protein with 4Fe4S-binding SPASM domain